MTEPRPDLMELTPEALTALANPGFVKRAFKDLAEGRGPRISLRDDGAIEAVYADGHTAALAAGQSLRDAVCTCPASGLCRHRVTLIPAYQDWVGRQDRTLPEAEEGRVPEEMWSPAEVTDEQIEKNFKKSVIRQAAELAKSAPTIRLVTGSADAAVPTAYLPMSTVRFFSARNLAHARCDCVDGGGCAHVVLAILAFRQARPATDEHEKTIVLGREDQPDGRKVFEAKAERCAEAVYDLLGRIWADGVSQPFLALEGQIAEAEILTENLKWRWISEAVGDLRRMLQAYHARSSRFSGAEFLNMTSFLQARLDCARYAENSGEIPASQILGLGVAGEVALDHLTLVGLGAELWEDEDREGVSCYFVDPDTMTLMVLERGFNRKEGGGHLLSRRVAGLSLKKMARSQIVTRGARRKANGLVNIAAEARLTNALPLSAQSWRNIGPPLKYNKARDLVQYRRTRPPEFVQPRQTLSKLAILPAGRVLEWGWDAGAQKLRALISTRPPDGRDDPPEEADVFRLELPYRKISEPALNNLARHLEQQDLAEICGLVDLKAGELTMVPLALTTAKEMIVLAAHEAEERSLPSHDLPEERPVIHQALDNLRDLLTLNLISGLRHRSPNMTDDLRAIRRDLAQLGLSACAAQLGELESYLDRNDRLGPTRTLGRLGLLLNQLQQEIL